MQTASRVLAPILGRILLGGYFLWRGIEHALNFPLVAEEFTRGGVPYASILTIIMIMIEVCGSILLIVDSYVAVVALVLITFDVLLLSMAFAITAPSVNTLTTHIALLGGLLLLVNYESQTAQRGRTVHR